MTPIALRNMDHKSSRPRFAIASKPNHFDFVQKYRDRWGPRA